MGICEKVVVSDYRWHHGTMVHYSHRTKATTFVTTQPALSPMLIPCIYLAIKLYRSAVAVSGCLRTEEEKRKKDMQWGGWLFPIEQPICLCITFPLLEGRKVTLCSMLSCDLHWKVTLEKVFLIHKVENFFILYKTCTCWSPHCVH